MKRYSKAGRPRIDPVEKRYPVNVSMTHKVRDMADRDAKAVGVSRSAYIVGLIRKGSKKNEK